MRRAFAAFALLAGLAGCSTFPVIEDNECGNAVLEANEDCDGFPDPATPGSVCRGRGVIGACRFDCTLRSDNERGVCPDNMGCASDGTCRRATGGFERPALISTELSAWVSAADFDGDGRADVISSESEDQLQQARFHIHYFDRDTRLVETRAFPRVTTRPIARHLNDDAADDLVFSNFRIGMMLGRKDRSFLPATFSSYVVDEAELRAVSVSDSVVDQTNALGIVVFTTLKGKKGVFVPQADSARLAIRAPLPRPIKDLVAPPFAAPIVKIENDSPCAEVVYGYRGERIAQVLDMCELAKVPLDVENQWREEPRVQTVSLPRGSTLQASPIAADVNGDGNLDLLLNDGEDTFVAYGDGALLQTEATKLTLPVEGKQNASPMPLPRLLAAGDITGDGAADFVIPSGILGSRKSRVDGSTVYTETFENSALPWTLAFVADLNRNEQTDVVAATEGADGISFINGSGGPYALGARITTRGPVRSLTTGDFDGDLVGDIAYVEGSSTGGEDVLAMSYGSRDQIPLEPVRVAEVRGVEQLGRQRALGVDDVFTASSERVGGRRRGKFTLFTGDKSRLPFAPYTLVSFPRDGVLIDQAAPALLVGRFTRAEQDDVLALGTLGPTGVWDQWLLSDIVAGNDPPSMLEQSGTPSGTTLTTGGEKEPRLAVAGVAVDLDEDGLDEAVWLMPGSDGRCLLLVYTVDAPGSKIALQSQLQLEGPCGAPQLVAADMNTDGHQDLLALIDDTSPRSLQILWNQGGGAFTLEDSSRVVPPSGEDVRAFSMFPGRAVKMGLVTSTAAFTATTRSDSRQWVVSPVPGDFEDARSVVVADPNNDGFPDMVVADARGLWLAKAELR